MNSSYFASHVVTWLSAEDVHEFHSERSAIAEFEGGLSRAEADAVALERTARYFGLPPETVEELLRPAEDG